MHYCALPNKMHVRRPETDLGLDVNIACMNKTKFVCDKIEQFLYDHVGNANQCSVDIIYQQVYIQIVFKHVDV